MVQFGDKDLASHNKSLIVLAMKEPKSLHVVFYASNSGAILQISEMV